MSALFSLNGARRIGDECFAWPRLAMAKALADNGATVIVNARDMDALSAAAERIGAEALPFVDVRVGQETGVRYHDPPVCSGCIGLCRIHRLSSRTAVGSYASSAKTPQVPAGSKDGE